MSLRLKNSAFLHIPKCGGEWVNAVLGGEVVVSSKPDLSSENLIGSQHCIIEGVPSFCFVRHPATWYPSYWRFKVQGGKWNPYNDFDLRTKSDNFRGFIEKVLVHFPGYLSNYLYPFFVNRCEAVGNLETIRMNLIAILDHFEEDVPVNRIVNTPPVNASRENRDAVWTPRLYRQIMESESETIEAYYDSLSF